MYAIGRTDGRTCAQAPWQMAAVRGYLNQTDLLPPASYFNASGRAYPDISAYGSNYFVYLDGQVR